MTTATSLARLDFAFLGRAELSGNMLYGIAAPYSTPTSGIAEATAEQFLRGAFDGVEGMSADEGRDAYGLWNHDAGQVLARVAAGTLRLRSDASDGMHYELDLPDTTLGRDVRAMHDAKLIGGVSVGFVPGLYDYRDTDLGSTLTHTRVRRLRDVSFVAFPAYTGTTAAMRTEQTPALPLRDQLIRARARALR